MRVCYTLIIITLGIQLGWSQGPLSFWKDAPKEGITTQLRENFPDKYRTIELNLQVLERILMTIPSSRTAEKGALVAIPLPEEGATAEFRIFETPVMAPGLAQKYAQIRSYTGYHSSGSGETLYFSYSSKGVQLILNTKKGRAYITPANEGNARHYIAYYRKDKAIAPIQLSCGWKEGVLGSELREDQLSTITPVDPFLRSRAQAEILEYQIAVACTGEWGQQHGGTVSAALADINVAVTTLNSIYENEAGIRFVLVENNDTLIFTNPSTDPYSITNNGRGLLNQNQTVVDDRIGNSNYDIGHVFTLGCNDVGGVAAGGVCNNTNKGRGVTCQSMELIPTIETITTHEIGHQFSAGHTWNNCPPTLENAPEQFHSGSAWEPGSGSTIMSYAGLCQDQNIVFSNDVYFHAGSLDEIFFYTHEDIGANCPDVIITTNEVPEISLPYTNGFSIPVGTPFELAGSATVSEGDQMQYAWDQYDLGPVSNLGSPILTAPLFRSFPPNSSPTRIFPSLDKIITNNFDNQEVLPDYSRDLTFRFTVRDNNPAGPATNWEQLKFKTVDNAGPFVVLQPDTTLDNWEVGEFVEIKWDVANTNESPVNCKNVNISLSIDGGFTYPISLMSNTPNDGAEFVVVPNHTTSSARVKVAAADNIFFDISNNNFVLSPPSQPGFALDINPRSQLACLPDIVSIDIETDTLLGFDGNIDLSVTSGLPTGASVSFSQNPIPAGDNGILSLNLTNVTEEGIWPITIQAIAEGVDTAIRTVEINTISNDFSGFALSSPLDGSSGATILPIFSWMEVATADAYDIEIATSPAFGNTIVEVATGVIGSSFQPTASLDENTLYYWRARPTNLCGAGAFSTTAVFHTESLSCASFTADNVPINISASGTPTIESVITITQDFPISDLNIPQIKGNHDLVKHLDVKLISPVDTAVLLFTDICGNTTLLDIGLDDEAPATIPCPPNDGQSYQPQNPLSAFDGQSSAGDWTLQMVVNNTAGEGGALESWQLELCSNINLSNPQLVTNDTLPLAPKSSRRILNDFLLVADEQNLATELLFTIVETVSKGIIYFNENPMAVGGQFSQADIDAGLVRYEHTGEELLVNDQFRFTVSDGEGGWLGTLQFNILVDNNVSVGTEEILLSDLIMIYPNPVHEYLNIVLPDNLTGNFDLSVVNLQGQSLLNERHNFAAGKIVLSTDRLVKGMYILQLRTHLGIFVKRFIHQ